MDAGSETTPLLFRFVQPLDRSAAPVAYDRAARVNMIAGSDVPAVRGGLDTKTQSVAAED